MYLVEAVYNRETKIVTNRTVKSYGRYDKLPPDFKKTLDDKQARRELANKLAQQKRDLEIAEATRKLQERPPTNNPEQALKFKNFNRTFALHYGHLALKKTWEDDLDLKRKINYIQENKTDVKGWSINDLLFLFMFVKTH